MALNADPRAPSWASRLFCRYVAFAGRHTGALLLSFLLLWLLCFYPALQLELHTDMAELLPDTHPAVVALRGIAGRQKSATNLVVLISSPDPARNRAFADALRPELLRLVPRVFTEVQWRPDVEVPDYARRWKWLYAERKDLESAEELLDRLIAARSSPLMVDLEGDPEKELRGMRERLAQQLPRRNDADHFEGKDEKTGRHYLGVMLWRRMEGLATLGDRQTKTAVQALVRRFDPASFHPAMKVEYTGPLAQAIDEQDGIREDVTLATTLCATLVFLAIYLYFRRLAVIMVIGAPAVLGLFLALALARYTIAYLNVNTAFLISIILGNGINSPIILMARYGEERRRGQAVPEALRIAMTGTLLGTSTAMLAASISYGCLLLTSFRGFNQFGLVGGAGMILVWTVSFLLVPPVVLFGERRWPGILTPGHNLWQRPFGWLGKLSQRRPLVPALLSLGLLLVALAPLWRYVHDPLEWNFNNLRSRKSESQRLWTRMEQMGMGDMGAGYIGNNGVLLVERPEQADPVADALWKQDQAQGRKHVLKAVRTLNSMLPREQEAKLQILDRIRRQIDKHRERMSPEEWREVAEWRPPDTLRKLAVADLPRLVREAFTEVDGHVGRLIGIDADGSTYSDWNGHDLLRMSRALRVFALGRTWVAASAATVFAGMLETIIKDGPRVTLAALCGVATLVLLAFGLRNGVPVLGVLGIGIVWLLGVLGTIQLKINFMNFVALPITLGVGAEYAANIWARLKNEGRPRIMAVIADTGSAVALCSTTTIIGYSSLLLARNGALVSFGKLADIGEVTCLLAALVALPAIWRLRARP